MNNKIYRIIAVLFFLILIQNILSTYNKLNQNQVNNINYNAFIEEVKKSNIKEVDIVDSGSGPLELKVSPITGEKYTLYSPANSGLILTDLFSTYKVKSKISPTPEQSFLITFFFSWGPTILFLVVWVFIMKKMNGGGKGLFNIGKSKANLINPNSIEVTFDSVVGCDEAKQEAKEFVEFLKNPEKFSKLGGVTPRGLLLTGPAGSGKTLLAKALAKESGVPFFSTSGSDFVEMFVGVGASRVRTMFEEAKKVAPCVIFIDEIDAIGGKRGNGISNSNSEQEQTLNQILVELDGMETNKGIILVGATNRPEMLDKALLRPGRIDRQIVVPLPDVFGREQILKIHSKKVPMDIHVDLSKIARGTPGFSGAELANLINEATIFAARRNHTLVDHSDLESAKDKILMGVERPSMAMTEEDKKKTAYHEAGHAVIARLVKNADPVYKVTIIPRGQALGVTMQLPEKDRVSHDKEFLEDKIAILMGGRAAEQIFCNTVTNGASMDIQMATNLATSMVTQWGMSKLGPIAFGTMSSNFLGQTGIDNSSLSQDTLHEVNMEIRNIINNEYQRTFDLLSNNKDIIEAMTSALIESETIEDWHIENIMHKRHYKDVVGLETIRKEAIVREEQQIADRLKINSKQQ